MPVHYFTPPDRTADLTVGLDELVAKIDDANEEIVATERYGTVTAVFTRRTAKPAARKAAAK